VSSTALKLRSIRNTTTDRARLAAFKCADPSIAWQAEVENFVQDELFEWRYAPLAQEDDPRVLLLLNGEELIGVAAHEKIRVQSNGVMLHASQLQVVAIATDWQGLANDDGQRVSDILMSGVMTDITARVPPRFARVMAVVHRDNQRSLRLCERYGFTEELSDPEELPEYRRLLTAHRDPG